MKPKAAGTKTRRMGRIALGTREVLREPILKALLQRSNLTNPQLETLLIDLVVEDNYGAHVRYDDKASLRYRQSGKSPGVSRGAFNRTLGQARKNITQCLYTMLLLAYLDLFDFTIFRPFEEIAGKIGDYRRIRDILAGTTNLTNEDVESHRIAERAVIAALENLASPLSLKTDLSRQKER